MIGPIVNSISVICGSLVGILLKKRLSQDISNAILTSLGAATFFMGIKGALVGDKIIIVILSMSLGTLIGSIIDIDKYIGVFGNSLKEKFSNKNKNDNLFVEAFVDASALFGIGAMALLGCLDAGLRQNYDILFTKSIMDFIASALLSISLGIGVLFSSISILIVEGSLTIFAQVLSFLVENEGMMNELTSTGNIIIMIIGLNLMKITKIKVANIIPALILAPLFYAIIY